MPQTKTNIRRSKGKPFPRTVTIAEQENMPDSEIVGLLPAAGQATRIAPLPCSKELYPVGFRRAGNGADLRPKVVCHYLLEKMRLAGVTKAYVILREGKWDIPAYFGDGKMLGMNLAYLMMDLPFGVPYTLDQAYPFVQDAIVALGFPDILFQPNDAFVRLLAKQAESQADIVLALFPAHQPHRMDMVDIDHAGRPRQIVIKPRQTDLVYTWVVAVWTPVFTEFMHNQLSTIKNRTERDGTYYKSSGQRELYLGEIVQAAIDNHLRTESVLFADHSSLDIGMPDNLVKAVRDSTL
jgi:glucose-1-phosphate thymidylyltransferase